MLTLFILTESEICVKNPLWDHQWDHIGNKKTQPTVFLLIAFCYSRGEKTRTSDPLHPMQVR